MLGELDRSVANFRYPLVNTEHREVSPLGVFVFTAGFARLCADSPLCRELSRRALSTKSDIGLPLPGREIGQNSLTLWLGEPTG